MISFRCEILTLVLASFFSLQIDAGRFGCCSSSAVDVLVPVLPAAPVKPVVLSVVTAAPAQAVQGASHSPASTLSSGVSAATDHPAVSEEVVAISSLGVAALADGQRLPRFKKIHLRRIAVSPTSVYTPTDLDDLESVGDAVCVDDAEGMVFSPAQPTLFSKSDFRSCWKKTRVRVYELKDILMAFRWEYTQRIKGYQLDLGVLLSGYAQVEILFERCLDLAQELRMGSKKKSPCGFSREYAQPASKIGLMYLGGMECCAPLKEGGTCKNNPKYEEFMSTCMLCRFDNIAFCFEQESCHLQLQELVRMVHQVDCEVDRLVQMLPVRLSGRR